MREILFFEKIILLSKFIYLCQIKHFANKTIFKPNSRMVKHTLKSKNTEEKTITKPKKDSEANKYDKILKENITSLIPVFINKILKMKLIRMENLPEIRVQSTIEAEPDFARRAFSDQYTKGFILQIDFETTDSPYVDSKILKHIALQHEKYKLPVDVNLIYLRKERPKYIKGNINFFGVDVKYPIFCLSEISFKEFIYSDIPEEVILSILADPEDKPIEEIVRMILERLVFLQNNTVPLRKFINQLKILSFLRDGNPEVQKQLKNMPLIATPEIIKQFREDENFLMGLDEGLEKGQLKQAIIGISSMSQKEFEVSVIADLLSVKETLVKSIQLQLQQETKIIELLQQKKTVEQIARKLKVEPMLVIVISESLKK
jgi:hypothetical protein